MLDAYQVEVIAVMTDGGDIYHDRHFQGRMDDAWEKANALAFEQGGKRYGYQATGEWHRILEDEGLTRLSRYSIHEEQSAVTSNDIDYFLSEPREEVFSRFPEMGAAYMAAILDGQFDGVAEDGLIGDGAEAEVDEFVSDWLWDNYNGEVFCDQCGEAIS